MNKVMRILGIILIVLSVLLLIAVPPAGVIGIVFGVLLIIKSKKELATKISTGIENAKEEIEQKSETLKRKLEEVKQKEADNKTVFNTDSKKDQKMGITDIFHISKFKNEIESLKQENESITNENKLLHQTIDDLGAREAITIQEKINEYRQTETDLKRSCTEIRSAIKDLEKEITKKRSEIIVLDETLLLESFSLYQPKFKFTSSADYKNRLDFVRDKQKDAIKYDRATAGGNNWTVNGSAKEGQKMIADIKKLFIRSFNNECDYCVDNVKFNNIEASEKRIEKSFEAINKLGRSNGVEITNEYKKLKFEELYLAFEYQRKKEQEKEEAKRAREELREQQKLEREIREAREKIAKEKKHFMTAIKEFEERLKKAVDEKERELITKNLNEAHEQLAELGKEEKVIDYREQNAKAGYVYVISNIGAFGEGVYKIGMTRRLEPMERVDELGDASVPFSFDVHAMIFSDNAPELEAKLHEHFYNNRINKINDRKEFFRADINEIEKVIKDNYRKIADVIKEAPAEQYRESLLIESK